MEKKNWLIYGIIAAVLGCGFLFLLGAADPGKVGENRKALEETILMTVANSSCGKITLIDATYREVRYDIGKDAKWSGFALKSGTSNGGDDYKVFITWINGEERREYRFTYNTQTKAVSSLNKEARILLDACDLFT